MNRTNKKQIQEMTDHAYRIKERLKFWSAPLGLFAVLMGVALWQGGLWPRFGAWGFLWFSVLSVLVFRAVAWEAWWVSGQKRFLFWIAATLALIGLAAFFESAASFGGFHISHFMYSVLAVIAVLFVYVLGYVWIKSRDLMTDPSKPFEV